MTTTLDKLLAEKQALLERLQQEDIGTDSFACWPLSDTGGQ